MLANGGGRGEVLPFFILTFVAIFSVAWFEGVRAGKEGAVFCDTAADAGRESKVEGSAVFLAGLGESGGRGVVLDKNM